MQAYFLHHESHVLGKVALPLLREHVHVLVRLLLCVVVELHVYVRRYRCGYCPEQLHRAYGEIFDELKDLLLLWLSEFAQICALLDADNQVTEWSLGAADREPSLTATRK